MVLCGAIFDEIVHNLGLPLEESAGRRRIIRTGELQRPFAGSPPIESILFFIFYSIRAIYCHSLSM